MIATAFTLHQPVISGKTVSGLTQAIQDFLNSPRLNKTPSSLNIPLTLRLESELEHYRDECAYPNWDGYDAEPLLAETVQQAKEFLKELPFSLQKPEVFVDPRGELFFEWRTAPYRAVVFINQLGRLSYSLSTGEDPTFDYGYLPMIPNNLGSFLSNHFSL
jgi:hypothetical protein